MTEHDIIAGVVGREGGFRAAVRRPNGTVDPNTMYGITAPTLGAWRKLGRNATIAELKSMSRDEAADIYRVEYIERPGFTRVNIPFEPLRIQMIDFGVNSGQVRAIRWLQRVLRVPVVNGVLDPGTCAVLRRLGTFYIPMTVGDQETAAHGLLLVNDALVAARSYMIDQSVDQGLIRREDEEGLESRALSFFLARP